MNSTFHPGAQTLKPRDLRRPRAFSNLRPSERTRGAVVEFGTPGALPKNRSALRDFTHPRRSTVPWPIGERKASLSKVMHSPPAFTMRARAVSVKRKAQIESLGTSKRRLSSVMVPTTHAIFPSLFSIFFASFDKDTGTLLRPDMFNLLKITLLNLESVRRAMNL